MKAPKTFNVAVRVDAKGSAIAIAILVEALSSIREAARSAQNDHGVLDSERVSNLAHRAIVDAREALSVTS